MKLQACDQNMFDIFIPTCTRDLEQLRYLMYSLANFLDAECYDKVYIAWIDRLPFRGFPDSIPNEMSQRIIVLDFDQLISRRFVKRDGWLLQQVAKLNFSKLAKCEYYIVLDSKNLALRKIKLDYLLKDSKAISVTVSRDAHIKWWRGAAWALRHPGLLVHSEQKVLSSITPSIFNRDVVLRLLEDLENIHETSFERFFLKTRPIRSRFMRPTEFSLYYTFLDKIGAFEKYHFTDNVLQGGGVQIWNKYSQSMRDELATKIFTGQGKSLMTGIHREAWGSLSPEIKSSIFQFITHKCD